MSVVIRRAAPDDIPAIASIAAAALAARVDVKAPWLAQGLARRPTYVAAQQNTVVGFVDGFVTSDRAGRRRFELDLLAVAASSRGQGIGGKLMAKSLEIAADLEAREIRALVRSQNLAMQRLCDRHGFGRSPCIKDLYVADAKPVLREMQWHEACLIPVETLAYRGVWLEGALSQNAIDAARVMARQRSASRIGALIPAGAGAIAGLLLSNHFVKAGEYHWWTISLGSD